MAITALGADFWFPTYFDPQPTSSAGALQSITMNASGDRVGYVFRCPKTGTLDKAELYINAVGNNPDNGIRVSFQTVDVTTGMPDTTQDQYRDVTGTISAGWLVPGLMTSDGTDVGSKRSVTAGEWIAVVVDFVTFVALDSVSPAGWSAVSNYSGSLGAYVADGSTGTYAKSTTNRPVVALKYDDGTYAVPNHGSVFPLSAFTSTSVGSGSTPDEYANHFQIPIKARCVGLWARVDPNEDFELVLYSGTTAERTISADGDITQAQVPGLYGGYFSTSYELLAATSYRVAIKPTTATTIGIYRMGFASTSIGAAFFGGAQWYESSRTDAGAWSDTTTNKLVAGLILDGFDVGGGSGGTRGYVG